MAIRRLVADLTRSKLVQREPIAGRGHSHIKAALLRFRGMVATPGEVLTTTSGGNKSEIDDNSSIASQVFDKHLGLSGF